jgi:hypothetical protein
MPRVQPRSGRELVRGVNAVSHAKVVSTGGRWRFHGKGGAKKTTEVVTTGKAARWYAADDEKKPLKSRKSSSAKPTKLKSGYEAGQVIILLRGRFRGKRVVFLKQLASGTLLVTGKCFSSCDQTSCVCVPARVHGIDLRENVPIDLKITQGGLVISPGPHRRLPRLLGLCDGLQIFSSLGFKELWWHGQVEVAVCRNARVYGGGIVCC